MKYNSLWVHGNAAKIESPENCESIINYGWGTEVSLQHGTWIHMPLIANLPITPLKITYLLSVQILFYSENCAVDVVDIYDGGRLVAQPRDRVNLVGDYRFTKDTRVESIETLAWGSKYPYGYKYNTYLLEKPHPVFCGIGISFYTHPEKQNERPGRWDAIMTIASACANFKVRDLSKNAKGGDRLIKKIK